MAERNKNDDVFSFDDFLKVLQQDGRMPAAKVVESVERLRKTRQEQQRREEEAARKRQEEEALRKKQEEEAENRRIADITSMELPMDWENLFAGDTRAEGVHADSISDGMILSLTELGVVDMEYIAAITGEELKTVICTLKGSVFQNPETWEECFYKGWETAEQYLSGNMVEKWKAAKEANKKYNGYESPLSNGSCSTAVPPPPSVTSVLSHRGSNRLFRTMQIFCRKKKMEWIFHPLHF